MSWHVVTLFRKGPIQVTRNMHAHNVVHTLSGTTPTDGRGECHTRNTMEMENKGKMSQTYGQYFSKPPRITELRAK